MSPRNAVAKRTTYQQTFFRCRRKIYVLLPMQLSIDSFKKKFVTSQETDQMSDFRYQIERDSHNRLRAEIGEDLAVGIKILAETDPRRVEKNVHAYAVLDARTSWGTIRIRDIRVMFSQENDRYFLRWRQWNTGKVRDGRKEYLDVAGPLDRDTRKKFEEQILAIFHQVRADAAKGTLACGDTGERLTELRADLEKEAPAVQENTLTA